jgi:hypothetical protein
MKRRHLAAVLACAAIPLAASAQNDDSSVPAAFRLVVSYDRPGLLTPHWQITVPAHGPLAYVGKPAKGNDAGEAFFQLSPPGHAKLADILSRTHGLQPCETKSKGIANMGTKTFDYTPEGGAQAHCEYNFTDNKALSDAFDYVLAIAVTVQTGAELERLHRYDRLGLDPVMIRLVQDVKDGHAAELSAIRPALESLATDVAVMDRVRARAQQLLDMATQQEKAMP